MCLGDSVCLQVKLVSTYPEEQTLWVQDYKEEKSEILSLYNKVTKEISEEINVILTPQEESMLAEYRTVNNEAYDAYLKGLLYWDRLGREDLEKAIEYFNTAVGKDPSWAPPYAGLASSWGGLMQMGFVQPTVAISKIYDNLNKALELDPKSANSHYVKAIMAVWLEWNWEKGEEEFLKTIELNPNDALSHAYYAHLLSLLRRPEESLNQAQLALELDPLRPLVMALYATVMINTGNYQDAVDQTKKALSIDPNHFFANVMMEYASYYIGDYKRSIQALKHIYQLDNDNAFEIDNAMDEQGYIPALKILIHILEERGKAGFYLPFDLATYNLRINEYEKALDWIEKGYEVHDPNMPYITTKIAFYDQLKGNPRFIELLKKLNLPVD